MPSETEERIRNNISCKRCIPVRLACNKAARLTSWSRFSFRTGGWSKHWDHVSEAGGLEVRCHSRKQVWEAVEYEHQL